MKTRKQIESDNLEEFINLANDIEFERDPEPFLEYLIKTDYFYAPAAKGHHDSCDGGLYTHCKNMFKAMRALNELIPVPYTEETMFFIAFGHDLCKIDFYKDKEIYYKEYDEKQKKEVWKTRPGYEIVDSFPIGHGEKSVLLLSKVVELTQEEMLAIRYHMGAFEVGVMLDPIVKSSYEAAQSKTPLVRMAHCADLMAVTISQATAIDKEPIK